MVGAFILAGITIVGNSLSWEKHQGYLVYFKSLPISKFTFILAILLEGIVFSLPSVITIFVVGGWYLSVPMELHWGILPLLFLAAYSVAGVGVVIGLLSPNHQMTNLMTNFAYMGITFLSPVMVRMDQLPVFLQKISYLLPTTYVAEAFRTLLAEGWTHTVTQNVGMILLFSGFTSIIILTLTRWREDE
jgi:ABC-2 type transport system permease protein